MKIKGPRRIVEMDWAAVTADGSLRGRIYFHMGDDSSFVAVPDEAGES